MRGQYDTGQHGNGIFHLSVDLDVDHINPLGAQIVARPRAGVDAQ